MKKLILLPILILFIITSCTKDDPPPVETEFTDAQANDSLYYVMNKWYYWYNLMPQVVKENYSDPYKLMDAMTYKPIDKWSRVETYEEYLDWRNGKFVGHGFRIGVDESSKARIVMLYQQSSLYKSGVRRGWIVKKINGTEIAPVLISNNTEEYTRIVGESIAGITNIFLFEKPDGSEVTISSTKSSFEYSAVLHYDTLNLTSGLAGHLVFESFLPNTLTKNDLEKAFAFFKTNNVKDLILDLRYNPGGSLTLAQDIGSYLTGNSYVPTNEVFAKIMHNDKQSGEDGSFPFISKLNAINLTRLVVITTENTASASEVVMNGLKPFMPVVSIGGRTSGKPMGMYGWIVGDKYVFWPISFKVANKNSDGDYYDGISPDQSADDDITHDFKNREELCLKEAIGYLQTGSFSRKGSVQVTSRPNFSEKPSWRENGFTVVDHIKLP